MERPSTATQTSNRSTSAGVNLGLAMGLFGGAIVGSLLLTAVGLKFSPVRQKDPSRDRIAGSLELT